MHINIFVDPAVGVDDSRPIRGTFATPYQSLARAAQRAAFEALVSSEPPGTFLGTIHALSGRYQPPIERFPIIIPPDFDLIGAGRGATQIAFTGESREELFSDGTRITYWGGDAIYVGRHIRGLSLRSMPAPGYSCFGMTGILCQNDGSIVEDVHVFIDPADAGPPTDGPFVEVSFGTELFARGIELTILDSLFERASRNALIISGCDGMLMRITCDNAVVKASGSASLTIDGCLFRNSADIRLYGNAVLQNSFIEGGAEFFMKGVSNRFGPGNDFRGEHITAYGNGEIIRNSIEVGYSFLVGEATRIIDNDIRAGRMTGRILHILGNDTVIQGNTFTAFANHTTDDGGARNIGHDIIPIEIEGSADFGGGVSAGGNDFGNMFNDISTRPSYRSRILINAPEAVVRFDDNFWPDPENPERDRFQVDSSTTTLTVLNPMRSS